MKYTSEEIIEFIRNGNQNQGALSSTGKYIPPSERFKSFNATYKLFAKFTYDRQYAKYYEKCLEAVRDEVLLGHIIFCNDVHNIPPALSFVKYYEKEIKAIIGKGENSKIENYIKKSIGAFWSFVFKRILGYTAQEIICVNRCFGIKKATYYKKE
jgi:hypothetical protein